MSIIDIDINRHKAYLFYLWIITTCTSFAPAIGIVAAGRIHSGFVKPGMSVTFGPTDLSTKVRTSFN